MATQRASGLLQRLAQGSLVKQILVGLVLGILLAWISKPAAEAVGLLGTLFVGALKAVAPVLVLMLVMASIANHQHGQKNQYSPYSLSLPARHLFSRAGGRCVQLRLPFNAASVQ
ncbi:membrane transport protein [Salmonella enterica subsp. enterica]|uniref:Membrane transport protein n=1 Tax=Salmonella enterica I TaxID=59201 RepID=A0A379VLJ0_SALET|nr:membrane transport protein [Salmonella enterica subsp. enterica]